MNRWKDILMQRTELHKQGSGWEEMTAHEDRTHPRCNVLASQTPLSCLCITFLSCRPELSIQTPAATHHLKAKQLILKVSCIWKQKFYTTFYWPKATGNHQSKKLKPTEVLAKDVHLGKEKMEWPCQQQASSLTSKTDLQQARIKGVKD